jgi:adenosine deaminase CECR1
VEDAYAFVDRHRDLWVGINMAGREDNEKGYPSRFLSVYRKMMGKYPTISLSIPGRQSACSSIKAEYELGTSRTD